MDSRSSSVRWPAVLSALALAAVAALGCKSALMSAGLLLSGYDIPPEYEGLKDKKVAVVCKMVTMEELNNSGTARALSEAICQRLKANNKSIRCHLIESQKVANLLDEKGLEDPREIGKQLKADKVIAVDIESFGVHEGQTLYRGRSTLTVHVYDVANKDEDWQKAPLHAEYPSWGPTPAQDKSEVEFRNQFVASLAEQIGRSFYPHDRYAHDPDETR
jgi:hypothetical protein